MWICFFCICSTYGPPCACKQWGCLTMDKEARAVIANMTAVIAKLWSSRQLWRWHSLTIHKWVKMTHIVILNYSVACVQYVPAPLTIHIATYCWMYSKVKELEGVKWNHWRRSSSWFNRLKAWNKVILFYLFNQYLLLTCICSTCSQL